MSGLRFKVGELAIFSVASNNRGLRRLGEIVSILVCGPVNKGHKLVSDDKLYVSVDGPCDYVCYLDGDIFLCQDWQLRKINHPGEPESLTRTHGYEVCA